MIQCNQLHVNVKIYLNEHIWKTVLSSNMRFLNLSFCSNVNDKTRNHDSDNQHLKNKMSDIDLINNDTQTYLCDCGVPLIHVQNNKRSTLLL